MAIQVFSGPTAETDAKAVADPKHLWHDGTRWTVFTAVDIPTPSQEDQDRAAANAYAKLSALKAMTPAQVQAWVTANVTTLVQAQDAIATLAIAVGVLARRL